MAGAGVKNIKEAGLISKYFDFKFYLIENESKYTFETAVNLKKFINIYDGPLLLATNPIHHKRTILALKKQNFEVFIPDDYLKNKKFSYSIIPSTRGIRNFNEILYESSAIVWYYFTGKI